MAYYNGNYGVASRQPINCSNHGTNRGMNQRSSSGCSRNSVQPQPCIAGEPHSDMPNTAEKMCMLQPRMTPAEGTAQSCVMPSPYCPVAFAYVPFQAYEELFDESKAFMVGTAFPSLFKPFMRGGKCR